MKPTKLVIENIGKLAGNTEIAIDKPLILFYGEIKQGKTTVLNCVRWVCGGEFPADIISHGKDDARIELHFDGGAIFRSFYRSKKDNETRARAVEFIKNGRPVTSPVAEIKRFLNPFLLDQDFLRNKSERERKTYFTELFAVDTTALDTELFNNQREATALRSKIDGYGTIDLQPFEFVNVAEQKAKLESIRQKEREARIRYDEISGVIMQHNAEVDRVEEKRGDMQQAIEGHRKAIAHLEKQITALVIPKRKEVPARPEEADTKELEAIIENGLAQNVRANQYEANQKRAEEKKQAQDKLDALEKRGRTIKNEKRAKLKNISETCGIKGLSFDEFGNFIYDGTTAGMISDSQIMRLSSELSSLYPEGFGIDLIDRAESLGKSIFEFIEKAKAENKSILATIVGERPTTIPENVGVFVVNNGQLSTKETP